MMENDRVLILRVCFFSLLLIFFVFSRVLLASARSRHFDSTTD